MTQEMQVELLAFGTDLGELLSDISNVVEYDPEGTDELLRMLARALASAVSLHSQGNREAALARLPALFAHAQEVVVYSLGSAKACHDDAVENAGGKQ